MIASIAVPIALRRRFTAVLPIAISYYGQAQNADGFKSLSTRRNSCEKSGFPVFRAVEFTFIQVCDLSVLFYHSQSKK